jgi:transcriptional regulator with XRE-family HTH domain
VPNTKHSTDFGARAALRQRMGTTQMELEIKLHELHLEQGIGLRIAARRRQLHWSQRKLARAIGCSQQTISAYESGECSISAVRLSRILRALRVDDRFADLRPNEKSPVSLKGDHHERDQLQIEIGAQLDPEDVRHRQDTDAHQDRGAISGGARYCEAHTVDSAERRVRFRA